MLDEDVIVIVGVIQHVRVSLGLEGDFLRAAITSSESHTAGFIRDIMNLELLRRNLFTSIGHISDIAQEIFVLLAEESLLSATVLIPLDVKSGSGNVNIRVVQLFDVF